MRLGKAGELLRPEVFEIEQPADLTACRFADDQRVRRGQSLQPSGEVRRLADDPGERVTFKWKDYRAKTENRYKLMTLDVEALSR